MKILKFIVAALLVFMTHQTAAQVKSVSNETTAVGDDGSTYKAVSVSCSRYKDKRVLKNAISSNTWCDSTLPSFCGTNIMAVAKEVCGKSYATELRAKQAGNIVTVEAKPSSTLSAEETISLEEKLLEIERENIKLQARRIELRKKQLELDRLRAKE